VAPRAPPTAVAVARHSGGPAQRSDEKHGREVTGRGREHPKAIRHRPGAHGCRKGCDFTHPPDADGSLRWPEVERETLLVDIA